MSRRPPTVPLDPYTTAVLDDESSRELETASESGPPSAAPDAVVDGVVVFADMPAAASAPDRLGSSISNRQSNCRGRQR